MIPITTLPIFLQVPLWILLALITLIVWLSYWPTTKIEPQRASKFRRELVPSNIDTIVVGSGSGGCACANILAQSGKRVLILEQHPDRTGGCTHTFRDHGCEWDTGLHYTSKAMGDKTQRAGAIMDFMTKGLQKWTTLQDPYDEVVFPPDYQVDPTKPNENTYPFVRGAKNTAHKILDRIDPNNTELKHRALEYLRLCEDINSGFTALGLSRVLPKFLHFLVQKKIDRLMTLASMTVRDVQYAIFNLGYTTEKLVTEGCPKAPAGPERDPAIRRLKAVFTHPIGDYAVQPRDATMAAHGVTAAHYMEGASYTIGPTQNISIRTSSMVRNFGGEVFIDAHVQQVIVEDGKAVGVKVFSPVDNEIVEIRAKNVVWASGIYNLYKNMLPQDLPKVLEFEDPNMRSCGPSNGHIFLFVKIRGDATQLKLPTHNLWYFNGYDMDEKFDEYFQNPREVRPPTCYVGFPCTKDTTWPKRYPNVSNAVLISDGLWEWFEPWKDKPIHERGEDYEQFKEELSKHLLDILYDLVPQVRGKVEFYMLGTPLSEVTYLASYHGGSYGTKCVPSMFDVVNRKWTTTPRTSIPNLYLAGSDAYLPAVCGAMYGGVFSACTILGHWGTARLMVAFLGHFAKNLRESNPKLSWPHAYYLAVKKFLSDD